MATKKPVKAKSERASKSPINKADKVLGYFRPDSAVGCIAKIVVDEKTHKIDSVLAHVQREQKVSTEAAKFAFAVVFTNKYPGNKIGKIQAKSLGHATVNLSAGTVQFHRGNGKTEIIRAAKEEKKPREPRRKSKSTASKGTEPESQINQGSNPPDDNHVEAPATIN